VANDTRSDELLTLGLVGLGLAHELNSPLTAAALGLELLTDRLRSETPPAPTDTADAIDRVLAQVRRMALLVDRFRRFARGEGDRAARVDLDAIADAVHALVRPALAEISTVELVRTTRASAAVVVADAILMEQAVAIAVLNAADALRLRGGRIELSVRCLSGSAVLDVDDDGPGFAAPSQAGQVGFSSKGVDGMGIGLPLARRIVEDAGGALEIGNRDPGGARVRLRLPLAPADAPAVEPAKASAQEG
jgi:signal transduction histidine kinase